ncbi:MAG: SGNH/GDSL hydrolase family protein [Acidobacteria bacterium]|nr:SGNH/GDSL hydrolase family protein [Acidobacteriota bacterium]
MRPLGLLLASFGLVSGAVAADRVVREKIEWLDVWIPDTNDHGLPRVLLIGDSIAKGYGRLVEERLKGTAYVARLTTSKSLGDPALPDQVALVLKEQRFDVIHFNNGLHGEGYSEQEYAAAFPRLLAAFRRHAPHARLIWASTTDVRAGNNLDQESPETGRVMERNRLAAAIARKRSIPIDDLFTLVRDHAGYHAADGVHFNPTGNGVLAAQVSAAIARLLAPKARP